MHPDLTSRPKSLTDENHIDVSDKMLEKEKTNKRRKRRKQNNKKEKQLCIELQPRSLFETPLHQPRTVIDEPRFDILPKTNTRPNFFN